MNSPSLLLARKDLRTIFRSRSLLIALILYPLVIAALLITLLYDTDQKATIALVNEDPSGRSVTVNDKTFSLDFYREQAEKNGNKVVEIPRELAMHRLDEGQVDGVLVVPAGFFGTLTSGVASSDLNFYTGSSVFSELITQRVRGSIYELNLSISKAFVSENAKYLKTLVEGGMVNAGDNDYDVLGLSPTVEYLDDIKKHVIDTESLQKIDEISDFAADAEVGLKLANGAMKAVRAPVKLHHVRKKGKSPQLTARGVSFSLAVAIAFICTLLVSTLLAVERDEHVMGRLLRGIAQPWQIVLGKILAGCALATVFSTAMFIVFVVQAPHAWSRLPLLMAAVWMSSFTFSTIGTLLATITRDARTATLCGLLVILPMVPLSLLHGHGTSELLSQLMPFEPSVRMFNAMLFDGETLKPLLRGFLQLSIMSVIAGGLTLRLLRRLA